MKRVLFTIVAVFCCASLPQAGRADDAALDPYALARSHPLPPLPHLVPTSLTPAAVTAFVDRQRALDGRERETHSHFPRGERPVRELKRTTITRGEDYLIRTTDEGVDEIDGRVAGKHWSRSPNGTILYSDFVVRPPKREELDEALGEVAAPHQLVVRRLWRNGDVEIDHFDIQSTDEVRQDDNDSGTWVTSTFANFADTGTFRYSRQATTDYNGHKVTETIDDVVVRPVDAAEVAIPPSKSVFALAPGTMQTIPVKINNGEIDAGVDFGNQRLTFIVDTGSTLSSIDVNTAERLHLEKRGNTYVVPTFRMNGYAARNVVLRGSRLDHRVANGTEIGILGSDFFSSFVVGIDYRAAELTLIDPGSFDGSESGGFSLPIRVVNGAPFAEFQIGDHSGDRFLLDTGSNLVIVTARFARKYGEDVRDRGSNLNHSGHEYYSSYGSGFLPTYPAVVDHIALGPMRFNSAQLQVEEGDGPPVRGFRSFDGIVGYNLLRYFDIYFDYSRNQAWFAPNGDRSLQRSGRAL